MRKNILLAILAIVMGVASAWAQSTSTFAYASPDSEPNPSGTGKKETYDIAIALTNPSLVGKTITAIEVPVIGSNKVSGLSAWVTSELKLQLVDGRNTNIVDHRWEAEMPTEGYIQFVRIVPDEPYTIPAGGTYVGYSLTVNEVNKSEGTQVPIVTANGAKDGGFYLHTSRSFLDWADRSATLNVVAMTQVELEGDFYVNAATLGTMPQAYVAANKKYAVSIPVHNIGLSPIESLSYITTLGDAEYEGTVTLDTPIQAVFAYYENVDFILPACSDKGSNNYSVRITGVNGQDNDAIENIDRIYAKGSATVLKFVPKHLAVVEEFTGTWCGWCPYGLVGMEMMGQMYPDFVGIAYHDNDPMAMKTGYPLLNSGFPSCAVNRVLFTHPYEATGQTGVFSMPQVWEEYCSGFCPVGIDLYAYYDEVEGTVTVTSKVEWVTECPDPTANYRVEYVLVADDLTGESGDWYQHNYFCSEAPRPDMEFWCNGTPYMSGIHYNDVAILTTGTKGVAGSITTTDTEQPNVYTHTFDLRTVLNYKDKEIPYHADKLGVVAMLLSGDDYGQVVNAVKCNVTDDAGVADIATDPGKAKGTYNLQGIKMEGEQLSPGLYVIDGQLQYRK